MQMRRTGLLPLTAVLFAGLAAAQSKVGIININAAIANTKDGQAKIQELEGKFAPKKKELEKKQGEIQALQSQMQKGGTVLSEEQKSRIARDIDTKTKAYNRDLEDAQQELEAEQQKIFQELGAKMMVVIDKHAKEKGFSLIMDVSSQQTPVLYASDEVDITKAMIEAYDKQAPTAAAPAAVKPLTPAPKPATPPATKK